MIFRILCHQLYRNCEHTAIPNSSLLVLFVDWISNVILTVWKWKWRHLAGLNVLLLCLNILYHIISYQRYLLKKNKTRDCIQNQFLLLATCWNCCIVATIFQNYMYYMKSILYWAKLNFVVLMIFPILIIPLCYVV